MVDYNRKSYSTVSNVWHKYSYSTNDWLVQCNTDHGLLCSSGDGKWHASSLLRLRPRRSRHQALAQEGERFVVRDHALHAVITARKCGGGKNYTVRFWDFIFYTVKFWKSFWKRKKTTDSKSTSTVPSANRESRPLSGDRHHCPQ